jgi:iron complex outermembrane receptor protein
MNSSTRPCLPAVLLSCSLTLPCLAAGASTTLSELKQLNVEDLMNLEVTSVTRHPARLLEAASAIQVVTQAEIRRSGATTLPEALRLAGNLQVAQRGSHGWAISARGFNTELANKLLVMIDGRTVYTPLFSGVFWEAQDYLLEDIDRIEVISGPGGTLWGANAVNGVINVITREAVDSQGLHLEAAAGSQLESLAGLRYGGSLAEDVHFRVYGKHIDGDRSVLGDGSRVNDDWRRTQGGFRVDSADVAGHSFTLQGDGYQLDESAPTGGEIVMRGVNLLGRWTHTWSADSDLSLQAYYDRASLSDPVPALMIGGVQAVPPGTLRDRLDTFDLDFHHRFPLGSAQVITWGLGFRHTHDVVTNAPGLAFFPAELDQQLYSAFLQAAIRLREDLVLTVGSKLEHNDYTGLEYEPGVRLQWRPLQTQTFWGAISRAVRTPSRVDRDLSQAAPPYIAVLQGRPEFTSEKVVAYEAGWRAQAGSTLTTSVAVFYNDYSDIRSTSITPLTILPFFFANNLEGHTWGVEFAGSVQLMEGWSLHGGYNLLREDLRVKPGTFDLSNARNETSDPEHQVTLRSSTTLPGGLDFDAGLRWVDTLQNSNGPAAGSVPSYVELDARLAWHATRRLELALVGRNLLDDHHPEYGFPGPNRAEAQRSVHGKVTWRY